MSGYPLRRIVPDQVYFITVRTLEARLLFRPDDALNRIVEEWLVRGVQRYGIILYGGIVVSSHLHLLVKCPRANLHLFMQYVERHFAVEVNKLRKRHGTVFPRRYSAEHVLDNEAMIDRLLYILTNPVKDGLVERALDWPGFSTAPELLEGVDRTFTVFDRSSWHRDGKPDDQQLYLKELPLVVTPLPCWKHLSGNRLVAHVRALVEQREDQCRKRRKITGRSVLGVKKILATDPFDVPRKVDRSPRPLCHAGTKARWMEFRESWVLFTAAYRQASERYRAGKRATFPEGSFPPWPRAGPIPVAA